MIDLAPFSGLSKVRLRWKLVIFVVAVIVCVSIFFLIYIPAQIERYASQALKNKGSVVTAMTATNVSPAMVFDDTVQINDELRTAQLSTDLMYAVVHDTLGRLRASWQMNRALAVEYAQTPPEGNLFGDVALRLTAPIIHGGRRIGVLYVGFSNAPVVERESEARARTLIVTLLLLTISVAVIIGGTAVVTRHLRTVVDTAQYVAAGDMQQRVHVPTQDDVGELGYAFNLMLDRLESSQKELAEANRDLEARVANRTRDLEREVEVHQRTEASLRVSERRIRQVIDLVPHFIFAKDLTGRYILVNTAVAETYGTTVEILLGKTDADFASSPEEAEHFRRDDLEVMNSRMPKVIREETITGANGIRRIMQTIKIPFTFSGSDVPAVLGVSTDITATKEYQDQLQSSLREKDVMLKEIHHRVKNNLQVISSLLSLQSASVADPVLRDLMLESQNRIRSMALVHERLYRSGTLATIDFSDYLNYVVSHLARSYDKPGVHCTVSAEPESLTVDDAIPCGLIVNELISNCYKHAFPDPSGGKVEVQFHAVEPQQLEMVVRDDGIGFPEGVDFSSMASMGMTLVTNLVDQLDGSLVLERDHGTLFRLRFPRRS